MSKVEITCKDVYEELKEIKNLINNYFTFYKLINAEAIEEARDRILKLEVRKKIFTLCDNKRTVTQIAQKAFPGELTRKSKPKASYHLAILEDYGMIGHRDEKRERFYYKKRG